MERAVQWYTLITCLVIGLSHIVHGRAWAELFAALHRLGKPGAFMNGALSLIPGAVFVAVHHVWSGPAIVITLLAWLLLIKGTLCFLVPDLALRSLAKAGTYRGRQFAVGGLFLWAIAAAAGYALWGGV